MFMKKVASSKAGAGKPQAKRSPSSQSVHFEFFSPEAHEVSVAGTFNNWRPDTDRMSQETDGKWVRNVTLKPGTYEYRFVVDGKWEADPNADHTVMNPYGERNSLLTVSEPATAGAASSRSGQGRM